MYSKDGKKVAELTVPARTSNVCFGGKDNKTLFINAGKGLYAVPTLVAGGSPQ